MFAHICSSCNIIKKKIETNEKGEIFFINSKNISYAKDSPFTNYFEKKSIEASFDEGIEINDLYFPGLFQIIKRRLHLYPLWSGIMLKHFGIERTRLSNNYVEKWFHDLKIDILQKNKNSERIERMQR